MSSCAGAGARAGLATYSSGESCQSLARAVTVNDRAWRKRSRYIEDAMRRTTAAPRLVPAIRGLLATGAGN